MSIGGGGNLACIIKTSSPVSHDFLGNTPVTSLKREAWYYWSSAHELRPQGRRHSECHSHRWSGKTSTNNYTLEVIADFEDSSFSFAASAWRPPTTHLSTLQPLLLLRRNSWPWAWSVTVLTLLLFFIRETRLWSWQRVGMGVGPGPPRLLGSHSSVSQKPVPTQANIFGNISK